MDANLDVLKQDLKNAISRNTAYRRENKKKAEKVVVVSAGLSAVTTLTIALSSIFESMSPLFQTIALLVSGSLTVVTAWDGFYNHKRLWLLQADILNKLYEIDTEIRHHEANNTITQEIVNTLFARYQSAFHEFNAQWKEIRTDENRDDDSAPKS